MAPILTASGHGIDATLIGHLVYLVTAFWTELETVHYEARHPLSTKARLAFDLLLYTNARPENIIC